MVFCESLFFYAALSFILENNTFLKCCFYHHLMSFYYTTVQRTFYYATGLPMSGSLGRSKQPNLYNGKEYEQVHGYNVYDFGARGYYATIARFTSIDPLAENTPWQSPYSYASNNFIAEIDWMGLGCLSNMLSVPQYSWAAIN